MARRRLQAILATTVLTVGLSSGPALAQGLGGLTDTLEETVASTSDEVTSTTEEVVDTVTGLTGRATTDPAAREQVTTDPTTTDQASTDPAATEQVTTDPAAPTPDTTPEDGSLLDLGTGDGTLDVNLDVDVAPSDEDGSPQLEVDGGITVADTRVDVGGATDPIEDAVDPDEPVTDGDTSSDQATTPPLDDLGELVADGGIVAAGDAARPVITGASAPTASNGAPDFSLVSDDHLGVGLQRFGGGTMHLDRVAEPEIARPAATAGDAPDSEQFPEVPEVADGATPAVLATQAPTGNDSPLATLLRALAGALVLGTGAAWTRTTRDA